jgi:hypothetical protein
MTLPDSLIFDLPDFPEPQEPEKISYEVWLKQCEALLPTLNKIRFSPENLERLRNEIFEPFVFID